MEVDVRKDPENLDVGNFYNQKHKRGSFRSLISNLVTRTLEQNEEFIPDFIIIFRYEELGWVFQLISTPPIRSLNNASGISLCYFMYYDLLIIICIYRLR